MRHHYPRLLTFQSGAFALTAPFQQPTKPWASSGDRLAVQFVHHQRLAALLARWARARQGKAADLGPGCGQGQSKIHGPCTTIAVNGQT